MRVPRGSNSRGKLALVRLRVGAEFFHGFLLRLRLPQKKITQRVPVAANPVGQLVRPEGVSIVLQAFAQLVDVFVADLRFRLLQCQHVTLQLEQLKQLGRRKPQSAGQRQGR